MRMDVREARLEQLEAGLTPVSDGWFVVNVADARWETSEAFGASCLFDEAANEFAEVGFSLTVLAPGQPNGMYHRESAQEDFLVLSGECLLLIEEQERRLCAGDFVHCPPETDHIFIGAGDGPCVIFMTGARKPGIVYPRSELALRHNAGVEVETPKPREAYAAFAPPTPGRPADVPGIPLR
jgi:uncharacterized cupin superfamily protein